MEKNIHAQALGKLGGAKSVESRFAGKTKVQISEQMSKVRKNPILEKKAAEATALAIKALKETPRNEHY